MTGPHESDGRPGQKDHIEHIRTVHFTLVVVSFALLVGSSLRRAPTTQRALAQLESIDTVVAKWDDNWLNKRLEEWSAVMVPDSILFVHKSAQRQGVLIRVGHAWSPADTSDYAKFEGPGDAHVFDFERPSRLIEFKRLWNRLDSLRIVHLTESPRQAVLLYNSEKEPDSEGVFSDRYEKFEVVPLVDDTASGDLGTNPLEVFAEMVEGDYREWIVEMSHGKIKPEAGRMLPDRTSSWVLRSGHDVLLILAPVPIVEPGTYSMQREFADSFRLDWLPGSFSRTFPELASVSANLTGLTLGMIDTILRGELERSDESVEVFGARIPAEGLAHWGGPVLFVIQLYLFLHLGALAGRIGPADPAWQTPWIGLYKGWLAESLTVLSCVVVPGIVFGVLVFQQRRHPWTVTFWVAFGILVLGLCLAWPLTRQLLALRNALPAGKKTDAIG